MCASLNDIFSRSVTVPTGAESSSSSKAKEGSLSLPDLALDLDVLSQCVAYAAPTMPSKAGKPELPEYEDVPI